MDQDSRTPTQEKCAQSNRINRREIEPLLCKAYEILTSYARAVGSVVLVLDRTGNSIDLSHNQDSLFFCALCRKYAGPNRVWGTDEYPCTGMHQDSVIHALRRRGPYMYSCDLGFMYCTSAICAGGRQIGALIAGRLLAVDPGEAAARIQTLSCGAVTEVEARSYLVDIPSRTLGEIQAMAQMLQFCTDYLVTRAGATDRAFHYLFAHKTTLSRRLSAIHTPQPAQSRYPLDKERSLLMALHRGDNASAQGLLAELLDLIAHTEPEQFEFIQLRAMELVVLLSREALTVDRSEDGNALETNNRYLKEIQESQTVAVLTETMGAIFDRISGQIRAAAGVRHGAVLRKAQQFIWENYTRKLSLREVAEVAGLSSSYFSTIFKEETGETLSSYVNRLRVEKAATLLTETEASLSEVAGRCGFEDQSWFSKIFKSYTGLSPRTYREQGGAAPLGLYCALSG
ncbi:MAG: helix-turn-helix domain-containing protein [Spirochaetaceae bacterium]|nr:helix-turn-helix domain-containing protein [Spirochaetaceae bacterium]